MQPVQVSEKPWDVNSISIFLPNLRDGINLLMKIYIIAVLDHLKFLTTWDFLDQALA